MGHLFFMKQFSCFIKTSSHNGKEWKGQERKFSDRFLSFVRNCPSQEYHKLKNDLLYKFRKCLPLYTRRKLKVHNTFRRQMCSVY